MERPAGPRPRPAGRLTDASSCAGARVPGPCLLSAEGPLRPSRAPPDLSAPLHDPGPTLPGAKGQALGLPGMGFLGRWGGQSWSPVTACGPDPRKVLLPSSLLWIPSRAPQPAAPRGTSAGCSLRNSLSVPPPCSPTWSHPDKGKLDGLGREPLSSVTYFALCVNDFILNSPTSAGILRQWGQAAWA